MLPYVQGVFTHEDDSNNNNSSDGNKRKRVVPLSYQKVIDEMVAGGMQCHMKAHILKLSDRIQSR